MTHKTIDEQLAMLHQMTRPRLLHRLRWGFLGILTGLGGLALYTLHTAWIMGTLVFGLMTWGALSTMPRLQHAARGAREGERRPGEAWLRPDPDSESGVFLAEVYNPADETGAGWAFSFIPQGWAPEEGQQPATLVYLPEVPWPVLVMTQAGVLLPRSEPRALK